MMILLILTLSPDSWRIVKTHIWQLTRTRTDDNWNRDLFVSFSYFALIFLTLSWKCWDKVYHCIITSIIISLTLHMRTHRPLVSSSISISSISFAATCRPVIMIVIMIMIMILIIIIVTIRIIIIVIMLIIIVIFVRLWATTFSRASSGQSVNQSIVHELIRLQMIMIMVTHEDKIR